MRKHPLALWVYWIFVIALVGFIDDSSATGRIVSFQPGPDSVNSVADEPSAPTVAPSTVLAEAVPEYRQVGIASWYGGRHPGPLTPRGGGVGANKTTPPPPPPPPRTRARGAHPEN